MISLDEHEFMTKNTCCTFSDHHDMDVVWWNLLMIHVRNKDMWWLEPKIDDFNLCYDKDTINHVIRMFSVMIGYDIIGVSFSFTLIK